MDIEFKIGDEIIDCYGVTGHVIDICHCNRCKERGFYEPVVEPLCADDYICITDYDKENGFESYFKIGDKIFTEHVKKEKLEDLIYQKKQHIKKTKYEIERLQNVLHEVAKSEFKTVLKEEKPICYIYQFIKWIVDKLTKLKVI